MTLEERIKLLLGELQMQNAALAAQLEIAHNRIKELEEKISSSNIRSDDNE